MIQDTVKHEHSGDRLLVVGLGVIVVYWLLETYIDTLVGLGSFVTRLVPVGDVNELWTRGAIVVLLLAFTRFAQRSVARHQQTVAALRACEERLEALRRERQGGTGPGTPARRGLSGGSAAVTPAEVQALVSGAVDDATLAALRRALEADPAWHVGPVFAQDATWETVLVYRPPVQQVSVRLRRVGAGWRPAS